MDGCCDSRGEPCRDVESQPVTVDADAWLASIFRRPVFKVSFPAATEIAAPLTSESVFQPAKPAFYYAKVPTRRVTQVSALTRLGFSVVDVNVTLERPASASLPEVQQRTVTVRDGLSEQREAILAIAESCFVYSRFHLDPQIPDTIANAVKRDWVNNYYTRQRGDRLFVAETEGRPVGFLAAIRGLVGNDRAWIIDLMGVHRGYQRRGVGLRLVETFVRERPADAGVVRVGTQAANVPSISLYEKCGFHVADTTYVLHAHV